MKLCLACGVFQPTSSQASWCLRCLGPLVQDSPAQRGALVERLVNARLAAALDRWIAAGLARERDRAVLGRILADLGAEARSAQAAREKELEVFGKALSQRREERSTDSSEVPPWAPPERSSPEVAPRTPLPSAVREAPRDAPSSSRVDSPEGDTAELVAVTFEPASSVVTGAADAFAALDLPGRVSGPVEAAASSRWETSVRPFLYENIGWFLGTLFVLAGSVYGVREAWRTLGGVPRHLLVVVAFALYHAAFAGLGRLLAPRSAATGRVLGGISVGLLPVLFTAVGALAEVSLSAAGIAALVCSALAAWTLRGVAERFAVEPPGALSEALLPSLLALVPTARLGTDSLARLALPWVGLGVLAWVSRGPSVPTLAAAVYGAATLAAVALLGTPASGGAGPLGPAAATFWASGLAALAAERSARGPLRERFPRSAAALEVVALAALAALCLAAGWRALRPELPAVDALLALVQASLAWAMLARAAGRHPGVRHLVVPALALCGSLAARCLVPSWPAAWAVGAVVATAAVLGYAALRPHGRERTVLLGWSRAGALAGVLGTFALDPTASLPGERPTFALAACGLVTVAAHGSGLLGATRSHYVGGLALGAALWTWFAQGQGPLVALAILCAGYGLLALLLAARRGPEEAPLQPLDDLALGWGIVGVGMSLWLLYLPSPENFLRPSALGLAVPARLGLGLALWLRAARDGSRWVALLGALTVGQAAALTLQPSSVGEVGVALGLVAVVFTALASLRGDGAATPREGRRLWAQVPLPWSGGTRELLVDGIAVAGTVALAGAVGCVLSWLSAQPEPERAWAIGTSLALVATGLLAFTTRALELASLRGNVGALAAAGVGVALAGVTNRVGRPLPPAVVGVKLTAVTVGVWALARTLVALGPGLARRLGRPSHGTHYHLVPLGGVLALGLLLAVDGALLYTPVFARGLALTPPTLFLGAALAFALLGRSGRNPAWWTAASVGALLGGMQCAATVSLRGPTLVRVATGQWVPTSAVPADTAWYAKPPAMAPEVWLQPGDLTLALWDRAGLGLALGAASLALVAFLSARSNRMNLLLAWALGRPARDPGPVLRDHWATAVMVVVTAHFLGGYWRTTPEAAMALLAAAALTVGARARVRGVVSAALALVTLAHAEAFTPPAVPWWVGPGLGVVACSAALSGPWIARRYEVPLARVSARTHPLALFLLAAAGLYALASGARADALPWGLALARGVLTGLLGRWLENPSLPVAAVVATLSFALLARQKTDGEGALAALAACVSAGAAASTGTLGLLADGRTGLALRAGTPTALAVALTAVGAHAAATHAEDVGMRHGLRLGRDLLLVSAGLWVGFVALAARGAVGPPSWTLSFGVLALAVVVGVALHAAWRERSARHVDAVQASVVAAYALVRAVLARDLSPEFDAVCALGLGFCLVGVTAHARRAGLEPVARATRRFAALLPLALWVLVPEAVSPRGALAAAGAGLLYGVLGAVERSRVLGALGAAAMNLALLLGALSSGLQGVEVYLGPVGLFVGCLGQLFGPSLSVPARNLVRVLGGLLVYLPTGWQLALQVGNARDGWYPVGFGLVCLAGVGAGMLLHLRAYLALGLVFLVLDVVASLVYAGLRDHRVGFLVLSLAGVGILATMVLVTLRRGEYQALVGRIRERLGRWE